MRNGGTVQKLAVAKLERDADVRVRITGCGLNEITRFQRYFTTQGVYIVVNDSESYGSGDLPIFYCTRYVSDSDNEIQYTIRIIYFERINHYRPTLNLTGAAGSKYYCIPCNKKYSNDKYHRCSNKCYKCLQIPRCGPTTLQGQVNCMQCMRKFLGQKCFDNHKARVHTKISEPSANA